MTEPLLSQELVTIDPAPVTELQKRLWRVDYDPSVRLSITSQRDKYVTYLKRVNGTANKEVWQVYDHLAADLFQDCLRELMTTIDRDLDSYCEKIITDEF